MPRSVTADPDSESSKARRACELGVPIIAESVLLAMLTVVSHISRRQFRPERGGDGRRRVNRFPTGNRAKGSGTAASD